MGAAGFPGTRREFTMIAAGAALPPIIRGEDKRRPNIILVALDQLCADRLHAYGNPRATSPNLDRMAAEGVRFSHFYSAAGWTAPSYGAIMTSLYPSRHGVTLFKRGNTFPFRVDTTLLAELFRKAGYKTGAFVNNYVAGAYLTRPGFDDYDEPQHTATGITERTGLERPEYQAPATNERVVKWIDRNRERPFFLFLLYWEPHSPYDPPPEHDVFKSDAYPEVTQTGWDIKTAPLCRWANLGDRKAIERLLQLYDGKIHFIDYYFGQVLEKLRQSGLADNTIVLLTSDHGEMMFTHPQDYLTADHRSIYDAVMHVPAILWGGRIPRGKTVSALATHIDIAPTLLELAGLPPKSDAQGQSLVPLMSGKKEAVHQYVFGEQDIIEPLRSVRDGHYKLIWNLKTNRKQLFDIRSDPGERHDISTANVPIVRQLAAVLDSWRKENEPPVAEAERRWREFGLTPQLIVDEVSSGSRLQLTGQAWKMADEASNFKGGCYWTEPAKGGEALRTALWRSDNPLLGRYRISIWYGRIPEGGVASNTPFTVVTRRGAKSFSIDQTMNTGGWRELGVFEDPLYVILTNKANGRVIVDAVNFELVKK